MLGDRGGLAVAQLIFYFFALLVSIFLCHKHGFGRSAGWVFLLILSLVRIAGSIAELVAVNDPSVSSITTATVLSSAGFSTLLMAQIGMLQRLNEGIRSDQNRIPPIVFRITILSLLAALGVSIAGGIYQASSHPSEQQQGIDLSHAAGIVFACAFGVMTIESLLTSRLLSYIITGDRILLFAIAAGFPFLLVRLIYIELVDFRVDYATLNTINGSVVAQGLLSVFPEFVVMIFFLGAGLRAPKIQRSQVRTGKSVQRSNQDSEAAYHMVNNPRHPDPSRQY